MLFWVSACSFILCLDPLPLPSSADSSRLSNSKALLLVSQGLRWMGSGRPQRGGSRGVPVPLSKPLLPDQLTCQLVLTVLPKFEQLTVGCSQVS